MTEKQRVVIAKRDLDEYKSKGYRRVEGESLAEVIGASWGLLTAEQKAELVLVELDAEAHRRLNSARPSYVVDLKADFVPTTADLLRLDAIAESDGIRTLAAAEGEDGGRWFLSEHIAASPRLAVQAVRDEILQAIAAHRRCAEELESFLQGTDCL